MSQSVSTEKKVNLLEELDKLGLNFDDEYDQKEDDKQIMEFLKNEKQEALMSKARCLLRYFIF